MNTHKVCSIIVTFNRKELLNFNIEAMLSQTYYTDILVVDNASTDGTREYLSGVMQVNSNILYCNTGKNIGGAGGFSYGLKKAFEMKKGYDLFWLMDDDGHPANNECLQRIISAYDTNNNTKDILNSIVECDYTSGKLSFGLNGFSSVNDANKSSSENMVIGYINPFNGTLVSRDLVQIIGFPNADYFIGYDEVEYITRGQMNAGSKFITVTNSIFYHPSRLPEKYVSFLGKKIVYKDYPTWKDYYRVRNTVYTMRIYQSMKIAKRYASSNIINCLLFPSKDKWNRIKSVIEGYKDGIKGDFSKNTKHINIINKISELTR